MELVNCMSCPHDENIKHLHIPKLTVCQICLNPLSFLRFYGNFCNQNRIEVYLLFCTFTSLRLRMNKKSVSCK